MREMLDSPHALLHWHDGLAPGHARGPHGELLVGGIGVAALAERYGTPLLAIDYGVLDAAIAEFASACDPSGVEIAYAGKALLTVALARHLLERGLQLDVCSIGELLTAERAGFPAERVSLHGCGKTREELEAAAAGRVGRIIVDNLDELRSLAALARPELPVKALLRMNTGIEAHTHEFVRTGGDKTKFGMPPDALDAAAGIFARAPGLRFTGLHAHIGSQIYEETAFVANAGALMEIAAGFARHGLATTELIVGGGFGVQMHPGEPSELDIPQTIESIARSVRDAASRSAAPPPRVGIEPGRSLIARAGTSIYRVMAVKNQFGRPYVVVDGGIADNPRPALYDAYHHPVLASRDETATQETALCGRSCENDLLATAQLPVNVAPGDLIAVCTTGAYTYSMSSNYNRFPRPAVVAVHDGTHSLMARRESVDDVLRNDCDA